MLNSVKTVIKNTPVLGPCLTYLRGRSFTNSSHYWDQRYRSGGTSGAGSYNRLAEFKAQFLNEFVSQHQIASVIEYGSGDGAQLSLSRYPSYIGIDVSSKAVEMCRVLFAKDRSKRFLQSDEVTTPVIADLSLSLDVIYHLVEDSVFESYMRQLFDSARRFVIVYSSNIERDWPDRHVLHRQFTNWVAQNKPEWRLESIVKNAYPWDAANPQDTSFADFYVFVPR